MIEKEQFQYDTCAVCGVMNPCHIHSASPVLSGEGGTPLGIGAWEITESEDQGSPGTPGLEEPQAMRLQQPPDNAATVYSDYWQCETCGSVLYSPTTGRADGVQCWKCGNAPLIVGERTPTTWRPVTMQASGQAQSAANVVAEEPSRRSSSTTIDSPTPAPEGLRVAIKEIEEAAWARSWSRLKAARKALEALLPHQESESKSKS